MSIDQLVSQYLAWDRDLETRTAIERLYKANNQAQLKLLLAKRMSFGTAGLRAVMGPGFARMNALTIIQTAQGLAQYLKKSFSAEQLTKGGIVVGYDGRHNSQRFAKLTAAVMKRESIRVGLFSAVVPTPFVPYALRRRGCVCGVMVTASHNAKQYNGYKVYWANGVQITAPHDKGIARSILQNLEPLATSWDECGGDDDPLGETFAAYYTELVSRYPASGHAAGSGVQIVYTAMHGVAAPYATEALRRVGVADKDIILVREQALPDPEFSTVRSPNPEEGLHTMALAIRTAERHGARLILANDPDGDRLALCEKDASTGTWRLFTGNETGALLGWWAVRLAKARGEDLSRLYFISSFVSSSILHSMAAKEGLQHIPTLTGFKWMGAEADRLERTKTGRSLLAFEESIGYMWGTQVLDKDGISAAAVLADLACCLYRAERKSVAQQLTDIYKRYGFHISYNSYLHITDPAAARRFFREVRGAAGGGGYPSAVGGVRVLHVRDLSTGLDTSRPDRRATLPTSETNPIITFTFENGVSLTLRGSGTEPKLKWYSELISPTGDGLHDRIRSFVIQCIEEIVKPDKYGLKRRPEDFSQSNSSKL